MAIGRKASCVPSAGVTNPKPLVALNHFTVASTRFPGAGSALLKEFWRRSYMGALGGLRGRETLPKCRVDMLKAHYVTAEEYHGPAGRSRAMSVSGGRIIASLAGPRRAPRRSGVPQALDGPPPPCYSALRQGSVGAVGG